MSLRFEELDFQPTPMGDLTLRRRVEPTLGVDVFEVKLGEEFLMSSLFTMAEEELATLGLAAVAQTPPAPQPAPADSHHDWMGRMMDSAKMQERMQIRRAARMAHFKEVLQITPAQEGAWTAWTASMQPPANWKRPDRAELERLATPERIDRMRAHSLACSSSQAE